MISGEYMQSFAKYVESKSQPADFWGEVDFNTIDSKECLGVQVADIIAGTLSYRYDTKKHCAESVRLFKTIESKIVRIDEFPKQYESFNFEDSSYNNKPNSAIIELCYHSALSYINEKEKSKDTYEIAQIIVLKYLLFRFVNYNSRYISSEELIAEIAKTALGRINKKDFQLKIIGKLRDSGVVIVSSTRGYKIPASLQDLNDYVVKSESVIIPILRRLKTFRDKILLNTLNEVDIVSPEKHDLLSKLIDVLN